MKLYLQFCVSSPLLGFWDDFARSIAPITHFTLHIAGQKDADLSTLLEQSATHFGDVSVMRLHGTWEQDECLMYFSERSMTDSLSGPKSLRVFTAENITLPAAVPSHLPSRNALKDLIALLKDDCPGLLEVAVNQQ
ncbi:hypothetical protein FRB96_002689 [Tulasnella sp. 330]|nr:hypothetical protein FRB96_002689 [Tulasnella sp. 330]